MMALARPWMRRHRVVTRLGKSSTRQALSKSKKPRIALGSINPPVVSNMITIVLIKLVSTGHPGSELITAVAAEVEAGSAEGEHRVVGVTC